ncbi:MAG: glycyl-radical enzyme activating protein, partial [Desulfocapsaceae bacterium]|nr:glycyl-radical enzyme activating protein [Desulfocapsaceae bacterium]
DGAVVSDAELCDNCFHCVDICPHGAQKRYGRVMTVSQVVEEISKDEIFYFHSGGGVTISGGECFTQPAFTASILRECRLRGIDTAVETSLQAPWENIQQSLPFLNTMYVDIKHHDSKRHRELTSIGNETIISHLTDLDQSKLPFKLHLRIPLIPGINDDDETLEALIQIGKSLKKIEEIEILPYHRLGASTYAFLGRHYHLEHLSTPSSEYLTERLKFIKMKCRSVPLKSGGNYL